MFVHALRQLHLLAWSRHHPSIAREMSAEPTVEHARHWVERPSRRRLAAVLHAGIN